METRSIQSLALSVVGLGTNNFGGRMEEEAFGRCGSGMS